MYININQILESQNKTPYWLANEIGCDYHSLLKLCNGQTTGISFKILQQLCLTLKCSPNDILKVNE